MIVRRNNEHVMLVLIAILYSYSTLCTYEWNSFYIMIEENAIQFQKYCSKEFLCTTSEIVFPKICKHFFMAHGNYSRKLLLEHFFYLNCIIMYDAHSLVTHIHLVLFAKKKKDVEGKNNVFNVSTIQAKTIGITKTC